MDQQFSLQQAIDEHLDLKNRNAALEPRMPLDVYRERPLAEDEPGDEEPDEQASTDPSQDGLWSTPAAFDWGD